MKSLPEQEVKKLAIEPGPKQYLAFNELARRVRDNPSSWEGSWRWDPPEDTLILKAVHIEWAFIKWSQFLNDEENYELQQEQDARLEELEQQLDSGSDPDPNRREHHFFNVIGKKLRR